MRYLSLLLVGLLSVWLVGCASSKPGAAEQKTTYKTKAVPANFSLSAGGLSEPATVLYQLRAHCKGQNCIPDEAELSFHLQSGSNTVYLSSRNLSIQAGDKKYSWVGREWTNIYNSPPVLGRIKSVTLKLEELKQIATAEEVTGILAGHSFKWSYQNREPIRKLLSNIKSEASEEN